MRQAHHWAALIFLGTISAHLLRVFFTGRLPPAARDQLDHRRHHAAAGHGQRLLRLLAARRPALRLGPAHRLRHRAVDPGHRHVDHLARVRWRVPRARPARALLRAAHPDRPGRAGGADHASTSPSSCATSTPTTRGPAGATTTWWASGCGRPTPPRRCRCSSSPAPWCSCSAGLVQINPVWIYGPFRPADVSAASQPDWYMGFLDGALRIMPPWEIRAFGFEVPNPFFPGVVLADRLLRRAVHGAVHRGPIHQGPRRAPRARPAPRPAAAHGARGGRAVLLPDAARRGVVGRAVGPVRAVGELGDLDVPDRRVRRARVRRHRGLQVVPGAASGATARAAAEELERAPQPDPEPATVGD